MWIRYRKSSILCSALIAILSVSTASANSSWWAESETTHKHTNAEGQDVMTTTVDTPWNEIPYTPRNKRKIDIDYQKLAIDGTDAGLSAAKKAAQKNTWLYTPKSKINDTMVKLKTDNKALYQNSTIIKGANWLGPVLQLADTGAKIAGRGYEHDGIGMIAESAEGIGEWGAATAGAVAGAKFGVIVGGPAAPVTGILGAAFGAVAGSFVYQKTAKGELYKFTEKSLEAGFAPAPMLQEQKLAIVKKRRRLRKEANATYLRRSTSVTADSRTFLRAPNSKYDLLQPDKPTYTNKNVSKKKPKSSKKEAYADLKKKAENLGPVAITENSQDGIPVIPLNCTLDFHGKLLDPPNIDFSYEYSLEIRDGHVTGNFSQTTMPATSNVGKSASQTCAAWNLFINFTGTVESNVIHLTGTDDGKPGMRCKQTGSTYIQGTDGQDGRSVPYECNTLMVSPARTASTIWLNLDGTFTEQMSATSQPHYTATGPNCPIDASRVNHEFRTQYGKTSYSKLGGVWSIRK